MRFSLWLSPTGTPRARLVALMRRLRERGGGPAFAPHVTLLDGIVAAPAEAARLLGELAGCTRPFPIALRRIDWRDEYFRCLFAAVEPNTEMASLRHSAERIFGVTPVRPYEPHLSLLYGDLDVDLKRALAAAAGGTLDIQFDVRAVELVNATSGVPVGEWRTVTETRLR